MADKTYAIQVSHTVTEVFQVDARSTVDANTKLGMVMALTDADAKIPVELATAVRSVKTTRTVKHISQATKLVDDDDQTSP